MDKNKQIITFLKTLEQENTKEKYNFTVICNKCQGNNVTIFHGCDYYHYSSYTNGFEENCGLKCKACGYACNIGIE